MTPVQSIVSYLGNQATLLRKPVSQEEEEEEEEKEEEEEEEEKEEEEEQEEEKEKEEDEEEKGEKVHWINRQTEKARSRNPKSTQTWKFFNHLEVISAEKG